MVRSEETNEIFMDMQIADGAEETIACEYTVWEGLIGVPAIMIEQMQRRAATRMKEQTFLIDCKSGVGMRRICTDTLRYRCNIIDKAEKKLDIL